MSTIYVFESELSTIDSLAATDKFLVHDASTGRKVSAAASDVATYVNANLASFAATGGGTFSGTSSVSYIIGSTLSSRIGFYGTAGTSQPASAAQGAITCTVFNPTTCTGVIGFSTTAAMQDVLALIAQLRATLVANGLMKGAA